MRNFVYLFMTLIAMAFCLAGCSKDSLCEEQLEDVNPVFADGWLYSSLSENFCSFLNAVIYSDAEMNQDSLSAIAKETVSEIQPLFVQTKASESINSFLNSNWELNDSQNNAIALISEIAVNADFNFNLCAHSCEDVIAALQEYDRAPVWLYYYTLQCSYEQINSLSTKADKPSKEFWLGVCTTFLGDIYGTWIGVIITGGTAVGGPVGAILGLAVGVAINHIANHIEIEGIVVDEHGTGMQGASVKVAGESIHTTTGADGLFSLRVSGNCQIVISAPGYEPDVISVGNDDEIRVIRMTPAAGYQNGEPCN